MLNDLLAIERGLSGHGIGLVSRHPDIKDMAKGWALRARLNANGGVASVDIVEEAGRGLLWTLRDGQHNGFPGLKTASGILARRFELLRLLDSSPIDMTQVAAWPSAGHRNRIRERLETLLPLAENANTAAVPAAFQRFLLALNASPPFLQSLAAVLTHMVRAREDKWLDPVRAALIGPVALAIDVADDDFERDAGDVRQIGPVSAALSVSVRSVSDQTKSAALCSLSGKTEEFHSGNFPQPNLPGLGQTYIFSRNKDIPSLTRFGKTADASFRISADLVRRLSGAITALTGQDARGKTWRLIPAETGDKPDLLVVSMADPGMRLADALADDDEVGGEAALRELGSRVIDQSKGIYKHSHPQSEVTVLILRTVDPANRKAIYHRRTTAVQIWEAAKRWQVATSNTPDWLGFPCPVKGKSEAVFQRPQYVSPLSITPMSRVQFANGGRRRVTVIGVSSTVAFGVFLYDGDMELRARSLLSMLIQRHASLCSGLASSRIKGIEHLKDFDPKVDLRRDALRSANWIAALLYCLGRAKEVFMSDAGFRLGQLLATADAVHVGYCLDVRKGSIPSSLLGNSVLDMAATNPHKALELLCRRWSPYAAWLKNTPHILAEAAKAEKNKAILLRTAVSQARRVKPIAAELAGQLRSLGGKTDETFKAELLLGYMAGLPKGAKSGGGTSDEDEETNEGEEA